MKSCRGNQRVLPGSFYLFKQRLLFIRRFIMSHKLIFRIIIGYILLGILGFIVVANFTSSFNRRSLTEQMTSRMQSEASLLAENYAEGNFSSQLTLNEFQEHLAAVSTYLDADVYVISTDGEILVESSGQTSYGNPEKIEDFDIMDFSGGNYSLSEFYGMYDESMLTVYATVADSYRTDSYVFLCMPQSIIDDLQSKLLNGSYLTFLILYLLSFIILLIYIFSVQIPLRKIVEAAKHYNVGDYEYPLTVESQDELGYLSSTFQYMTHELSTLEDDQRKFVSNVSHDFRSPLTSIKGYAQAMADGTIPPEMQGKYLNIILFETERLEKLTEELLDLNRYGSSGYILNITDFDLNECIRMTVQSFEQTATRRQISFRLVLTGDKLFVRADKDRIQQVLHNLIDNAVKFSNNNSSIDIETTVRNEKVFVSVKDHGIGIPKDSISKIGTRFYKTDISRGKDKKGTGLGLSIVKEIISAHNENINIISTEGVGSEFIFSLPLSRGQNET